jgi:hypothetical protein
MRDPGFGCHPRLSPDPAPPRRLHLDSSSLLWERTNGRVEGPPVCATNTFSRPYAGPEETNQLIFNGFAALKLSDWLMHTSPLYLPGTLTPVLSAVTVPENFSSDGSFPL